MNPQRRRCLLQLARWSGFAPAAGLAALAVQPSALHAASDGGVRRGRTLVFPRDHGAHLETRTEWWYATGWVGTQMQPTHGFQLTFFRSRTGYAQDSNSRFAARHLLFAHAALSDLAPRKGAPAHRHDQRIARWNGRAESGLAAAHTAGADVHIQRWRLRDTGSAWSAQLPAAGFELQLNLARSQPLLLQGDAGYSRKGPEEPQASHYYSEPQLRVSGTLKLEGGSAPVAIPDGRAWMDHEWSDEILHPQAVGWDWIGMNLFDGSALTAFVLRRSDGSALWSGGSWRRAGAASRSFGNGEVRFTHGRLWSSPATGARYPVHWQVDTPAGRYTVRALLDAQEMDGSASTGTVYWEGLSELVDSQGQRVGLGYLEMTGYSGRLRL